MNTMKKKIWKMSGAVLMALTLTNRMYRSKYGNGSGSRVQRGTCHSRIVYRKWCRGICTA